MYSAFQSKVAWCGEGCGPEISGVLSLIAPFPLPLFRPCIQSNPNEGQVRLQLTWAACLTLPERMER